MRYGDINTELRKLVNAATFTYNGQPMKKLFLGDWDADEGPHVRVAFHVNRPDSRELGFDGYQDLTGYIQVGFFIPATDKGINFALSDLSQQLSEQFKRSNVVNQADAKIQITDVQKNDDVRIEGHFTNTSLVNFTIGQCD
ncbi:putative tail-completion protein [Vibrio phage 242E40-1]|nr:putative tail-completion protein [Vibrio phage 242E40-1]